MIRCIKQYDEFKVGNIYHIKSNDTFGIYVLNNQGVCTFFDDDEELFEYFELIK